MQEWKEAEISEQLHFLTRLVLWNLKQPFSMREEQDTELQLEHQGL